jgi:integral membrane sensor domain MASE1
LAALIAGTMAAMPFLLFYDLVMGSVAAAWLVAAARQGGWLPKEQRVLVLLMIIALLAFPLAGILHLAIGCLAAPLLLWSALRRFQAGSGQ